MTDISFDHKARLLIGANGAGILIVSVQFYPIEIQFHKSKVQEQSYRIRPIAVTSKIFIGNTDSDFTRTGLPIKIADIAIADELVICQHMDSKIVFIRRCTAALPIRWT